MARQDWVGLSNFLAVIALILIVTGVIAYFYQTTYVTWLGTYYDYPYRGYVFSIGLGCAFCFIASFAAEHIGKSVPAMNNSTPPSVMITKKYCTLCGSEVALDATWCSKCGNHLV